MDKPTLARNLLASQRSKLMWAIATCERHEGDPYFAGKMVTLRKLLAKVESWEADLERAPDFFAGQVLGFMGEGLWAPLVRVTCGDVEMEARRVASRPGCRPTASAAQEGVFAERHPSRDRRVA